jgi:hypothetical protein
MFGRVRTMSDQSKGAGFSIIVLTAGRPKQKLPIKLKISYVLTDVYIIIIIYGV